MKNPIYQAIKEHNKRGTPSLHEIRKRNYIIKLKEADDWLKTKTEGLEEERFEEQIKYNKAFYCCLEASKLAETREEIEAVIRRYDRIAKRVETIINEYHSILFEIKRELEARNAPSEANVEYLTDRVMKHLKEEKTKLNKRLQFIENQPKNRKQS